MPADDVRRHARIRRQLNRLRKVARSDLDLMPAREKFRNQRAKERHVGGVGKIDPDAHDAKEKVKRQKKSGHTVRLFVLMTIEPRMRLSSSASSLSSVRLFSGMIFAAMRSLSQ